MEVVLSDFDFADRDSNDLQTFEDFSNHLKTPEISKELHTNIAEGILNEVRYGLGDELADRVGLSEVAHDKLDDCYNPELPTILVDAQYNFSGIELVGLANSRLDEPVVNIIYTPLGSNSTQLIKSGQTSKIQVNAGIMFDQDGNLVVGEFTQPPLADLLVSTNAEVLETCGEKGILTTPNNEAHKLFNDKHNTETVESADVFAPKRFSYEEMLEVLPADIVIKPSRQSRGRGVALIDKEDDPEHAIKAFEYLKEHEYEPVIEERVRSWPLFDPETRTRLDWNVRAVTFNGQVIGMYVRADGWGGPVNRSLGARSIKLTDLDDYLLNPDDVQIITNKLQHAATELAQTPGLECAGLDLTVDENGKVFMFEANVGNFGGLLTMARMESGLNTKLAQATAIAEIFAKDTVKTNIESHEPGGELPTSFGELYFSYRALGKVWSLCRLSLEEVPWNGNDEYALTLWALLAREDAVITRESEQLETIETRLITKHPLETREHLPDIILNTRHPENYLSLIEKCEQAFPKDVEWLNLRILSHIAMLDFPEAAAAYARLNGQVIQELKAEAAAGNQHLEQFSSDLEALNVSDEQLSELIDVIMSLPSIYFKNGYESVKQEIHRDLERWPDEIREFLELLELTTALACNEYDEVLEILETVDTSPHYDAYIDLIFNGSGKDTLEYLRFYGLAAFSFGMTGLYIQEIVEKLRLKDAEDIDKVKLVEELAVNAPLNGTKKDVELFKDTLIDLVTGQNRDTINDLYSDDSEVGLIARLVDKAVRLDFNDTHHLLSQLNANRNLFPDAMHFSDFFAELYIIQNE